MLQILIIAVGLSLDAFAVSICEGLVMKPIIHCRAVLIALFFGGFQALMPVVGWFFGRWFINFIEPAAPWITFVLFLVIGGKMIIDGFRAKDREIKETDNDFHIKKLLILSLATSVDALVAGVTLGFLSVRILPAVTLIGGVTFLFSLSGVYLGHLIGMKLHKAATVTGGIVLVLIGIQIVLEHIGLFP